MANKACVARKMVHGNLVWYRGFARPSLPRAGQRHTATLASVTKRSTALCTPCHGVSCAPRYLHCSLVVTKPAARAALAPTAGSSSLALSALTSAPSRSARGWCPATGSGDLIKGVRNHSQIGTLVERKTLYMVLVQLDNGKEMTSPLPCLRQQASRSSLLIPAAHGSGASTRTPMACCAACCPRART